MEQPIEEIVEPQPMTISEGLKELLSKMQLMYDEHERLVKYIDETGSSEGFERLPEAHGLWGQISDLFMSCNSFFDQIAVNQGFPPSGIININDLFSQLGADIEVVEEVTE